jgi:CHRD domain
MQRWMVVVLGIATVLSALAQSTETYKVRLAPVAIDAAMKAVIAGEGAFTATLAGTKFTLNGTFTGLKSNATLAHIHQGTAPGVRGGVLLNLNVTKAMNGEISGTFDLTPEQIENLHKGRWYVQIHSEKAPGGNLWGWLVH